MLKIDFEIMILIVNYKIIEKSWNSHSNSIIQKSYKNW